MNKLIGIVSSGYEKTFGVQRPYIDFFKNYGSVVMIDPRNTEVIDQLDLIVLPGGADVVPFRYGQTPNPELCGAPNYYYEYFDTNVLPKYIDNGTPIFGICRGLQSLNVYFGGTLYQHIYHSYSSKSRDELVHSVQIVGTNSRFKINSLHHQAVNVLGVDLRPLLIGVDKDEQFIEAFEHTRLKISAIQFHAEELIYEPKAKEANYFVDKMIKKLWE